MSTDNKPATAKTEQRIPVKRITLLVTRNLPGAGVTDTLLGDQKQVNKPRFVIEYIPSMRHHRICYYAPAAQEPTVTMIPESAVSDWEPVPQ